MIVIENLTKRFGEHIAVNSVSFTADTGGTLGLLGPNGAGKTTIMRMMTGYLPPTEGRVVINGMDMFDQPEEVKRKIGYLPEQPPVYFDMTVNEYLSFAGRIRSVKKTELRDNIQRVAALCGISDKLGRLIGNLSKGYRQRVGLAQALVHDPEILILDEPTVGLDPRQIIEIRELIKDLGQERTVILSSHILQEITSICRKVVIINEGHLIAFDSIENLSKNLKQGQRLSLVVRHSERVDMNTLRKIPHLVSLHDAGGGAIAIEVEAGCDIRDEVSKLLLEMDAGLLEMKTESLTLEEIFLRVITGEKVNV